MFAGVEKIVSSLSVDYKVLTRQVHWSGNKYAEHTAGQKTELFQITPINRYVDTWTHRVRSKWLIFAREEYYQQTPSPEKKYDFFFRKNLFNNGDLEHRQSGSLIQVRSEHRAQLAPSVYHRLRKLDCHLSHTVSVGREVVAYLFLPDGDLYRHTEEFPFCALASEEHEEPILPLIIAFSENHEYGQPRRNASVVE